MRINIFKKLTLFLLLILFLILIDVVLVIAERNYTASFSNACTAVDIVAGWGLSGGSSCNVYSTNDPNAWLTRYSIDPHRQNPFMFSNEEWTKGRCDYGFIAFQSAGGQWLLDWINKGFYHHKYADYTTTIGVKVGTPIFQGMYSAGMWGSQYYSPDGTNTDINNGNSKYGRHITVTNCTSPVVDAGMQKWCNRGFGFESYDPACVVGLGGCLACPLYRTYTCTQQIKNYYLYADGEPTFSDPNQSGCNRYFNAGGGHSSSYAGTITDPSCTYTKIHAAPDYDICNVVGTGCNPYCNNYGEMGGTAVGQNAPIAGSTNYRINRGYAFFDTASLPDNAKITHANLWVSLSQRQSTVDFNLVIQKADLSICTESFACYYDRNRYSGNYGQRKIFSINPNGSYMDKIVLNPSIINLTGRTNIGLRSDREINQIPPASAEIVTLGGVYLEIYYNYTPEYTASGLIFKSNGNPIAFIDRNGNMYIKGTLTQFNAGNGQFKIRNGGVTRASLDTNGNLFIAGNYIAGLGPASTGFVVRRGGVTRAQISTTGNLRLTGTLTQNANIIS